MALVLVIASVLAQAPALAENPNEIEWYIKWEFVGDAGNDVPLRLGQNDYVDYDGEYHNGFGWRHIVDRHGEVPPYWEIAETVSDPAKCHYTWTLRVQCYNDETLLLVVYTPSSWRPPDGRPLGIITAYRQLPGCEGSATLQTMDCPADKVPTEMSYTGPDHVANGATQQVSAFLADDVGIPIPDRTLSFVLGSGSTQQSCSGTTNDQGTAQCTINAVDQPASSSVPLSVSFAGDAQLKPSSTSLELALQTPTTLTYDGPDHLANGTPAQLKAALTDYQGRPVVSRPVSFALGSGSTQQSCTGTTNDQGTARCMIDLVDQPLTESGTVPLSVSFGGDAVYLPSSDSADLKLQYFTGRAYGVSTELDVPLLPAISVPPQPDTGLIRTADATTTSTPCAGTVSIVVLTANALCAQVSTTLDPGVMTSTSTVEEANVAISGMPVIKISGLTATAASRCDAATGSTTLDLTIGGVATSVPTAPNSAIDLSGGGRIVVNEQQPVSGADDGITVVGVRIIPPGGAGDIVIASSTSAVHNCAP